MQLLTTSELSHFSSSITDHWETFSSLHSIVVYKEPKKIITNNNNNMFVGYDDASNANNYTFVQDTGIFPCMVFTAGKNFENFNIDIMPVELVNVDKVIKVKQDAKDFIEIGQTERIVLDNREVYTQTSAGLSKNYGQNTYYYFTLQMSH